MAYLDNNGLSHLWDKIKGLIPTKTSDLDNDSGFITDYTETDPTVPNHVKNITQQNITNWNNKAESTDIPTKTSDLTNDSGFIDNTYHDNTKQNNLVSGENIKTINNQSILGSGNIEIQGGSGTPEVYIQQSEPTDPDWKIWIDTDEEIDSFPSEVVNSLSGSEISKAPSVAAVKEGLANIKTDNYSTNETVIGTWIDGKPLYRKVINFGTLPSNAEKSVAHNISNIDYVSRLDGTSKSTSGTVVTLSNADKDGLNYSIRLYLTTTDVKVVTGSSRSTLTTTYVIIEYTKTTD